MTTKVESYDGQRFRQMVTAGTAWLEKNAVDIDAINVFPVPDGDTGTNMVLTMRSAVEESHRGLDNDVSSVAKALAYGSLMGARGNSGVILSQVFRGIARGMDGKELIDVEDMVLSLQYASEDAYKSLTRPVEGTMLTVLRDAADAAALAGGNPGASLVSVMEAAVVAARESVAHTPALLPVLREAGVVDAGGQGIFVVLEGFLHHLKGEVEELEYKKPTLVPSAVPMAPNVVRLSTEQEESYGYCTEFMIGGQRLKPDRINAHLSKKGQSLLVVGDESAVRVHIHTLDPGSVLRYALSRGTLHQIKVENMDDQHREFLEAHREHDAARDIAIVAVVSGQGLTEVFQSLGATEVVIGGQTMNPSVREILKVVDGVATDKVIILPNNKNIVQAASQVATLSRKTVYVVPTQTVPQGIAAILAFNFEQDVEQNGKNMEEATREVNTVEVTKAVRSTKTGGVDVKKGQFIGIADGALMVAGEKATQVLQKTLSKMDLSSAELVTLYFGADTIPEEPEGVAKVLSAAYPKVQFEVVNGGQPHYYYIVSIE